jgi:hypothetical protein
MRTLFLGILSALLFTLTTVAHDAHYEHLILREWQLKAPDQKIRASFFLCKGDKVWLEKSDGKSEVIDLNRFSEGDQLFIRERLAKIEALNQNQASAFSQNEKFHKGRFGMMLLGGILSLLLFYWKKNPAASLTVFFGVSLGMGYLLSFKPRETGVAQTATNPLVIDSAFTPFKPKVYTHWDQTWFYVESKGIADHEMMTGITKWQQQVPIPQCYIGANAWQIPLNPVVAANPIPVNNQHFLRGAIALAANGIPIFNHTQTLGLMHFWMGSWTSGVAIPAGPTITITTLPQSISTPNPVRRCPSLMGWMASRCMEVWSRTDRLCSHWMSFMAMWEATEFSITTAPQPLHT